MLVAPLGATDLASLAALVRGCAACPAMAGRCRVPGTGRAAAEVFFVAEAPGRHGAEVTGLPLVGDRSGALFGAMVRAIGLDPEGIYVTNVVKCNPRDARGRNRPPTTPEIAACGGYLRAEVALVAPRLVVPLGQVACRAVTGLALRDAVGRLAPGPGPGVVAFALHHPAYVLRHRRTLEVYLQDWQALARALHGLQRGRGHRAD